ncbi:MAG: ABC transporter substrate-binding protein [bacterium]
MNPLRKVLAVSAVSAVAMASASAGGSAQTLVVAVFGGSFADNTQKCAAAQFEERTGADVEFVLGSSVQTMARLRAAGGQPGIDVTYMDVQIVQQAKAEDLIIPFDKDKLPNLGDIYESAVDGDDPHWVGFMYSGTALAYNPNELDEPPTSWQDLWDPQYQGRLAIPDISGTAGQHFLIATARMNGGSLDDMDPGFEAIAELAPHSVTFYTQADQIVSLLERGDIVIAPWYIDRVGAAAANGVPVSLAFPSEGAVGILPTVSIPEGAPSPDLAHEYVDVLLSPEAQECFAESQYAGPTNRTVELDPEIAEFVPYQDSVEAMYFPDTQQIARELPEWTDRWNREVAR